MANPIRFCGFNKRLMPAQGNEDSVGILHVYADGQDLISCWKLDDAERARVAATGEVWFSMKDAKNRATGQSLPPVPVFVSGLPLMEAMDSDSGEPIEYHSDGSHIVADAEYFARLHHGDQKYGKRPYAYHLAGVVAILVRWGAEWPFLVAGWLHDIIEDCLKHLTIEERQEAIDERFGKLVGALVWACTGTQDTRAACLTEQLMKIAAFPPAAIVKCADRLFNMTSAVEDAAAQVNPAYLLKLCRTYHDEYPTFRAGVLAFVPAQVIEELDAAYVLLQQYLSTQAN